MKPALKTVAQEECGVWLDTVQLKVKAKQKRVTRPISKLLNPLAKGGGYSLAVALNFTQTKMEMPKTKQSYISAFFTRQPRVLGEKPTSEVPNLDPVQSSLANTSPVASGTKRRRGSYLEKSDSDSESGADQEWKSENVTEPEAPVWQGPGEANLSPSKHMYYQSEEEQSEDFSPPQSKKRFTDPCTSPGDSQPLPQAWSQDPLLVYSQYSDSESYSHNQKNSTVKNISDSEMSSQSDDFIGFQMDLKGKTSTQKEFLQSIHSQLEDEKENCSYLSFKSPRKHAPLFHIEPLSNHQETEPKLASLQKHSKDQLWSQADKDKSNISLIPFKWAKPRSSPLKKQTQKHQSKEDEASLATLFTQDSEGFRVIAHRGLQTRSPLKESNLRTNFVNSRTYKSSVEEEEDEVLFTQDSQGNIVIKHC